MPSPSDRLFKLITGATKSEVDELAAVLGARPGETSRPDRLQHALVSSLAANRVGAAPTLLAGGVWESFGGLRSLAAGQPFSNDATGFDPVDMAANVGGTLNRTPSGLSLADVDALLAAIRAGRDPLLEQLGVASKASPTAGRIPAMLMKAAPVGGWAGTRRSAVK